MKNVFKTYPNGVGALYGLNLTIEKGQFVFIIGGSGSGKSTLISILGLLDSFSSGTRKTY